MHNEHKTAIELLDEKIADLQFELMVLRQDRDRLQRDMDTTDALIETLVRIIRNRHEL